MMPRRNIDWGGKESQPEDTRPEGQDPTPDPTPEVIDGAQEGKADSVGEPQQDGPQKAPSGTGLFGEADDSQQGVFDGSDASDEENEGSGNGVFGDDDKIGIEDLGESPLTPVSDQWTPPPPPRDESAGVELCDLDADRLYVFMYGKPQAGKSVILSGLFKFLQSSPAITLTLENKLMDKASKLKFRELSSSIREKKFVPGTSQLKKGSQVWEMKCTVTPNGDNNRLPELKLAFLELAGEDLKKIMVGDDAYEGELDPRIGHYLSSWDNVDNMCFFMVAPADEAEESDEAITDMFMYMSQNDMHEAPSIVMLSKWDKLQESGEREGELERILEEDMPQSWQQIISKKRDVTAMKYSIGFSEDDIHFDYDEADSARLARILYRIGTGEKTDPWSPKGGWFKRRNKS